MTDAVAYHTVTGADPAEVDARARRAARTPSRSRRRRPSAASWPASDDLGRLAGVALVPIGPVTARGRSPTPGWPSPPSPPTTPSPACSPPSSPSTPDVTRSLPSRLRPDGPRPPHAPARVAGRPPTGARDAAVAGRPDPAAVRQGRGGAARRDLVDARRVPAVGRRGGRARPSGPPRRAWAACCCSGSPSTRTPTARRPATTPRPCSGPSARSRRRCPTWRSSPTCACASTPTTATAASSGRTASWSWTASLPQHVAAAVSHARAGADLVAPSSMIDGVVGEIRAGLDAAGFGPRRHLQLRRQVRLGVLRPVPRRRRQRAGLRRPPDAPDGPGQRARGAPRGGPRRRPGRRPADGQAGASPTST